jgi:hypothetical protein
MALASRSAIGATPRFHTRHAGLALAWVVRLLDRVNGVQRIPAERALGVTSWDLRMAFRPMVK